MTQINLTRMTRISLLILALSEDLINGSFRKAMDKKTGLMAKEFDAGGNIKGCGDLIYGSFRKALDKKIQA